MLKSEVVVGFCMHKPRLHRLSLLYVSVPVYYLTACTADRQRILANPQVHEAFIRFGTQATERGVHVGRYVLMPDHIHLFAAFAEDSLSLSDWMKSLKNSLSKTLREQGLQSPHWQKGFFDHVLRSSESYQGKWQYVALNPVRAGLVGKPKEWPYQGEIHGLDGRSLER